jgi:hypothetical protein
VGEGNPVRVALFHVIAFALFLRADSSVTGN